MELMASFPSMDETPNPEYSLEKDDIAVQILKMLVDRLTPWPEQKADTEVLNITAVSVMLTQLRESELEVLYNATRTSSEGELIQFLNSTVMRPRKFEVPLLQFQEYRIHKILLLYIPPILILLGTFGNLLSFIVLRRKPMLKVSSYMYLAVLAVIDTLVLYNGLLRIWLVQLMGFDYQEVADWICKLTVVLGYVFSDLSVWLIIAVTVERYIVVCFPFQASSMCNVSRARKVIVSLFLLMLALNFHFLWTAQIVVEVDGSGTCRGGKQFTHLVEEVWPWVDTLIYSFLPFLTIMVLNVLIIREVAGARTNRMRLAGSEHDSSTSSTTNIHATCSATTQRRGNTSDGSRLTALLLTVSFAFLLLTLPNNIILIITRFWNQRYGNNIDSLPPNELRAAVHGMARLKLVMTVTELLMYTNHSINFFLYCATGNKFRQQILDLFLCLQGRRQPHTQAENTVSHSARKTSNSMLALGNNEIMLARRAVRRRSSCVSSDDIEGADKSQEKSQTPDEKSHIFVNGNLQITPSPTENRKEIVVDDDNFYGCDENSYQNGSRNGNNQNRQNTSQKSVKKQGKSLPNKGYQLTFKDTTQLQQNGCQDGKFKSHQSDRSNKSVLGSVAPCKVYQSKKKHKHCASSKRGSFGPACDTNSKDNEYILLQPTLHWCDSTAAGEGI